MAGGGDEGRRAGNTVREKRKEGKGEGKIVMELCQTELPVQNYPEFCAISFMSVL